MTQTIPDEAVQAALDTWRDHEFDGTLDYARMRNALTAAAPFLQGVKVDAQGIYDYVQGYEWRGDNGDYTPSDADREMLEDAIVGYLSEIGTGITVSGQSSAKTEAARNAVEELANTHMCLTLEDWSRISSTILSAIEVSEQDGIADAVIQFLVKHDMLDARTEYDVSDVVSALEDNYAPSAPSPRAQALEEALQKEKSLSDRLASALEYIDDYCLSYPDLGTISAVAQPALKAHSDARALSSQPVADGWMPIESAPKDGTEFIGWDGKWPFRCSAGKKYELYPHQEGGPTYEDVWDGHYYDSLTIEHPTHWRPIPASPGVSE